jgi:hypothetical protein
MFIMVTNYIHVLYIRSFFNFYLHWSLFSEKWPIQWFGSFCNLLFSLAHIMRLAFFTLTFNQQSRLWLLAALNVCQLCAYVSHWSGVKRIPCNFYHSFHWQIISLQLIPRITFDDASSPVVAFAHAMSLQKLIKFNISYKLYKFCKWDECWEIVPKNSYLQTCVLHRK